MQTFVKKSSLLNKILKFAVAVAAAVFPSCAYPHYGTTKTYNINIQNNASSSVHLSLHVASGYGGTHVSLPPYSIPNNSSGNMTVDVERGGSQDFTLKVLSDGPSELSCNFNATASYSDITISGLAGDRDTPCSVTTYYASSATLTVAKHALGS